jgi:hypothetical protein
MANIFVKLLMKIFMPPNRVTRLGKFQVQKLRKIDRKVSNSFVWTVKIGPTFAARVNDSLRSIYTEHEFLGHAT